MEAHDILKCFKVGMCTVLHYFNSGINDCILTYIVLNLTYNLHINDLPLFNFFTVCKQKKAH